MRILKRCKTKSGIIRGYIVEDNSKTLYLSIQDAILNKDKITNAVLLKNGDFRAKRGESIETIVDSSNLNSKLVHNYIDIKKLKDFSKKKDLDDVIDDIVEKYKITNIADDDGESVVYIAEALYDDYDLEMANYEAYIEEGMDARLLIELRKSACLRMSTDNYDFYTGHKNLNTAKEVDEYRTKYMQTFNKDYVGLNWQYWIVIRRFWGAKANYFNVDYESCFADGDYRKQTTVEQYKEQFKANYAWHPGIL